MTEEQIVSLLGFFAFAAIVSIFFSLLARKRGDNSYTDNSTGFEGNGYESVIDRALTREMRRAGRSSSVGGFFTGLGIGILVGAIGVVLLFG